MLLIDTGHLHVDNGAIVFERHEHHWRTVIVEHINGVYLEFVQLVAAIVDGRVNIDHLVEDIRIEMSDKVIIGHQQHSLLTPGLTVFLVLSLIVSRSTQTDWRQGAGVVLGLTDLRTGAIGAGTEVVTVLLISVVIAVIVTIAHQLHINTLGVATSELLLGVRT